MWCLETATQVHAYQPGQSTTNLAAKTQGVLRYGRYLHRKSQLGARRSVKKNIQANQRWCAKNSARKHTLSTLKNTENDAQVQNFWQRLLYVWHMRHPASGYVQGINDVATPFIVVFLSEHVPLDLDSLDTPP